MKDEKYLVAVMLESDLVELYSFDCRLNRDNFVKDLPKGVSYALSV